MSAETLTDRLVLTPLDSAQLDRAQLDRARLDRAALDPAHGTVVEALFAIEADPRTWEHLPEGVARDIAETRESLEGHAESWRVHGLGAWSISLREPVGELPAGAVIGLGGAASRNPDLPVWNLGYRLTPAAWGHGFATEVCLAAVEAVRAAPVDLPLTARALSHNRASWRVLERIGLQLLWEGSASAHAPMTADLLRRVYADRALPPDLLQRLIDLG